MVRSDRVVRLFVAAGVAVALSIWVHLGILVLGLLAYLGWEWVHAWRACSRPGWGLASGAGAILLVLFGGCWVYRVSASFRCLRCGAREEQIHWFLGQTILLGREAVSLEPPFQPEIFPRSHRHEWIRYSLIGSSSHLGLVPAAGFQCGLSGQPRNPLAQALESEEVRRLVRVRLARGTLRLADLERLLVYPEDLYQAQTIEKRGQALLAELRREAAAGRSP